MHTQIIGSQVRVLKTTNTVKKKQKLFSFRNIVLNGNEVEQNS